MSHFDELLVSADPGFFDLLGDPCVYTDNQSNAHNTRVVIEKNVEQFSAYETTVPIRRNVANLLKAEVPEPKRGHTIVVGADTYTVDQLDNDDGHILRVLLK
ncbi:head-tail joining protein [Marinobacter salarius]|uniref:head-tail joining protein n=1 Tax=Marinobacter salarius TaxID=1420917 RepID=UPI003BAA55D8